ncbi:hypothetical protein AgCh_030321 [Apium graveolens]
MYYQAIEKKSNNFKIPESPEAFRKLWQEELEIIQKLHMLKLNLVKLDHKKKCFSTYTEAAYTRFNTRQKIEWKVKEIEELKQSLYELYISKRARQRKDSDLMHEQVVKLHKGRQHGCKNLVKERQLHKKINQAREEVKKISGNSPSEPVTRICTLGGHILDTKEAITDYIKVATKEVKELRMKQITYRAYDGRAALEKAVTEEIRIFREKAGEYQAKKDSGVVRLTLAKNVAYNIVKKTTTYGLIKVFSNMYEKPSASNKVYLIRLLVATRLNEGDCVADRVNEFNSILARLTSMDIKFDVEVQALLLASSLSDSWSGFVTTINNSSGSGKMTFDGVRDSIIGKYIRRRNSGESLGSLLSAESRGRKFKKGQNKWRSRSKSQKRGQSKDRKDIVR